MTATSAAARDDRARVTDDAVVASPPHRRDIQGLRAVAVLLVLIYHAGLPVIPGGFVGVDVFFVISGFLITGLIVREVERTGRLGLRRFYARRIRRLLPAAALVLAATAAMTVLVLPVTRWSGIALDLVTAAFSVVNWRLAATSVDYLASEQAASPVQHFWSLAVEEQFYVLWPILLISCLGLRRRCGWPLRRTLAVGLAVVALPTLAWSAWYTAIAPSAAYFVSTTRLWELAVGALLVLVVDRAALLPRVVAIVLGWTGLVGIVVSAVALSVSTPFPGTAALLPVLSTAAVLVAGVAAPDAGASRLLGLGPLGRIGDASYSLYLWHWPFLVAATAVLAGPDGRLEWPMGLASVLASVAPAVATHLLVERPIHRNRSFLRGRVVIATLVVGTLTPTVSAVSLQVAMAGIDADARAAAGRASGAEALGRHPARSPAAEMPRELGATVPAVTAAADDTADVYQDGCHQDVSGVAPLSCRYGVAGADVRIALVGDSHAAQWQPTLRRLAEENRWTVDTFTKSSCGFLDVDVLVGEPAVPYTACREWNAAALDRILDGGYDLVITSGYNGYDLVVDGRRVPAGDNADPLVEGYTRQWSSITAAGLPLLVLADTPYLGLDAPECLVEHAADVGACAVPRQEAVDRSGDQLALAAARVRGATYIDLTDWVCPAELCSPVIGGVIVFRDRHHLTATYARSLAPALRSRLGGFDFLR